MDNQTQPSADTGPAVVKFDARKFFLVVGSTGEYSDRSEWVVCAFYSKEEAEAEVLRLTVLMQQLGAVGGHGCDERDGIEEKMRAHDPHFSLDYTGSHYWVTEAEIVGDRESDASRNEVA